MTTLSDASLRKIFNFRYRLEDALYRLYGIRSDGDYAALLVAKALGATVNSNGVERGFDLTHPTLGRIEVRSRRLPFDGRKETRAVIPERKHGYFEWLAHVLFQTDYSIAGAYLAPAAEITAYTSTNSGKIRFDIGAKLLSARDITVEVEKARVSL